MGTTWGAINKWAKQLEWTTGIFWWSVVIGVGIAAFVIFAFVYVPSPGYAITLLATLAVLMTLRNPAGGEKALWILGTFMLMVIEIFAITHDRHEQNAHFGTIVENLEKTERQNQLSSDLTQRQFAITLNGLSENLKMVTGGDSFCYLALENMNETGAHLLVIFQGKYPLYDVAVRISDEHYVRATHDMAGATILETQIGDIGSPGISMARMFNPPIAFKIPGNDQALNIFFNGRNGFWGELIRIRKINGQWTGVEVVSGALDPQRFPGGARLFENIAKDFPMDELKNDPDWVNVQKLPKSY